MKKYLFPAAALRLGGTVQAAPYLDCKQETLLLGRQSAKIAGKNRNPARPLQRGVASSDSLRPAP
jgi:hypothetical protein